MGQLPDRLHLWKDLLSRHDYVIFIWNMKGEEGYPCLEYVSENVSKYGYEAEEYLEGNIYWLDLVCEEDKHRVDREGCDFLLHAAENLHHKYRIVTKDGRQRWVESDSCYIESKKEDTAYVETVIRDVTENMEREMALLENQLTLQKEIFAYMESRSEKSFSEKLTEFIKEQNIETLQAAFSDIYGIHAAIIGRDYHFYTHMTGPKEEEGIFYDLAELRSFRKKIGRLEEILDTGQRNIILSMQHPGIRISGIPIMYNKEYVATWVICCLEGKDTEDILKILEFMRIMSETISEHFLQYSGEMSIKDFAFERYRLQKTLQMQETVLTLYEEMEDKTPEEKLFLCLKKAGETSRSGRCALYESVPNSIYAKCVCSWMTQEAGWNLMEREMYSVQALPDPGILFKNQDQVVLNSVHTPKDWMDTMRDLYASAAVLMPVAWHGKKGFLSFQEIGEGRVWEEEYLWLFATIKKIIEKALLKSE